MYNETNSQAESPVMNQDEKNATLAGVHDMIAVLRESETMLLEIAATPTAFDPEDITVALVAVASIIAVIREQSVDLVNDPENAAFATEVVQALFEN